MYKQALPQLHTRLSGSSPLAQVLRDRRAQPQFVRMRRLGSLLEHFHLKYTVTSRVRGRKAVVNGREVVHFGSFNYLGLEQNPRVRRAAKRAIDSLGTHSGCSRVFSSHENILELEGELASLVGAESALIGHNVSQIHAGIIPALFGARGTTLFLDRHAHTSLYKASLIAAAKGARVVRVDAGDPAALERIIRREGAASGALLVDGVYSMQGHVPELPELNKICRKQGLVLYVDDAHGVGVLGENGGGVAEACGLSYENLVLVGSLQKALGSYGGFVAAKAPVIDFLRVTSKAYIFSGALQPAAVEGAREAVRIARSAEGRRLRKLLAARSRRLRGELRALGFAVPPGDSPIVPVLIGSDIATLMAGRKLFDLGIYLNSVLYPAVPKGEGILRISLTTLHSEADLSRLTGSFRALRRYLPRHRNPLRQAMHLAWEVGKSKLQGSRYAGL